MNPARPMTYLIRVDGHLDDHWSTLLDGLTLARDGDGTTTLTCPVADQAQLHGVLTGLRDIGATLIELRTAAPGIAPVDGGGATTAPVHRSGRGPSTSLSQRVRPKGLEPPTF